MQKKRLNYQIILQPEPEGGFTVIVPELPGCVTYGKDLDEAIKMAGDAIRGYLFSLKKHKEKLKKKSRPLITTLEIEYVETTSSKTR